MWDMQHYGPRPAVRWELLGGEKPGSEAAVEIEPLPMEGLLALKDFCTVLTLQGTYLVVQVKVRTAAAVGRAKWRTLLRWPGTKVTAGDSTVASWPSVSWTPAVLHTGRW